MGPFAGCHIVDEGPDRTTCATAKDISSRPKSISRSITLHALTWSVCSVGSNVHVCG
jgi:hypothetical protein